ncbi:MAG TPA: adenosylcobinamide-phosphate synthase CbiB [Candidatus Obscuribacterales bacterium]
MPVSWCSGALLLPLVAALVDFVVGDPWGWLHPVQVMGWAIQRYQGWVGRRLKTPGAQRLAGIALGLGLPLLSGAIAAGTVHLMTRLHPLLGGLTAVILFASCMAGRSLRHAAEAVLAPLSQGDLPQARQQLSLYVGRDTAALGEAEILRAVLETISENAADGAIAPMFYGLVGWAIAPSVGVGVAIAYKALSTLDSMVGYRSPPYRYLGWFSARSEDVVTWLPCRLTVGAIALLSGRPRRVWHLCRRDAPADPSPNAGWSECAYAAALGVQLGGPNTYRGVITAKPLLGDPDRPITPSLIRQGLALTRAALLLTLTLGTVLLVWRYPLHC